MSWQPTDYNCPQCGGRLHEDPTRDVLGCEDCKQGFTEESVREWMNGGPLPDPLYESLESMR